jgi:regulator of replication initiation timing
MKLRLLLTLFILFAAESFLSARTFIREYTYHASDADSRITARTMALQQVKTSLLEEIGVYIESSFEDVHRENNKTVQQLSSQQIVSITAGITETKVLEERWDGSTYYIKAEITVDENDVKNKLHNISQDKKMVKDMENVKQKVDNVMAEIDRLNSELKQVKDENEKLKLEKDYKLKNDELADLAAFKQEFRQQFKKKEDRNVFGLGFGNPYFSLLYNISPRFALEPRAASDFSTTNIYGLRGYYNFKGKKFIPYIAVEGGIIYFTASMRHAYDDMYLSWNIREQKKGYMTGVCAGGSYPITRKIDFNIDLGPYYISLDNGYTTGFEWIINTGLRFWI